jgi:hyaluronan synthase
MRITGVGLARRWTLFSAVAIFSALIYWSLEHVKALLAIGRGQGSAFAGIFMLAFLLLVFQMVLCFWERPYRTTAE